MQRGSVRRSRSGFGEKKGARGGQARDAPAFSLWWVPSLTLMSTLKRSGKLRRRRTRRERPVVRTSAASARRPLVREEADPNRRGEARRTDESRHGAVRDGRGELDKDRGPGAVADRDLGGRDDGELLERERVLWIRDGADEVCCAGRASAGCAGGQGAPPRGGEGADGPKISSWSIKSSRSSTAAWSPPGRWSPCSRWCWRSCHWSRSS